MVVAAASLAFALATHFGVVGGADFTEGLVTADRPLSLDPLAGTQDQAASDVGHLLYRSLLRLDASAYPVADLASSFAVSANGLTYTLPLRPGLRWSDGRPLTAADVIATISFAQSSLDTDRSLAATLTGVMVRGGAGGVTLTLPAPRASLPAMLTELPILPLGDLKKAQLGALARSPATVLATSGPYVVSANTAAGLLLEANPYASERPRLNSVDFRLYPSFAAAAAAFAGGQVDALLATTPQERAQLLASKGATAEPIDTFRFVDLVFNERTVALQDPVVRHAFATAIDRVALIHGALDGSALMQVQPIPAGLRWVTAGVAPEPASISQAAAALSADGWSVGPGGVRLKSGLALAFTVTVPDAPPLPSAVTELAQQLAPLGISLVPDVVPPPAFLTGSLVPGHFDIALGDWDNGPDPDVSAFWRSNAQPPNGYNVSGAPADAFLDQALDSLATLSDRQARIGAAQQVDQLLTADAPAVFLYSPQVWYVFRQPLRSAQIPPTGGSAARFDDFATWQR